MLSPALQRPNDDADQISKFTMTHIIQVILEVVHVIACLLLMLVVLLQQGRGGGMGVAFGGATAQVFGGRGAGNLLTRTTGICAVIFMGTSVSLAYLSTSNDPELAARIREEEQAKKDKPVKVKTPKDAGAAMAPIEMADAGEAPIADAATADDAAAADAGGASSDAGSTANSVGADAGN